MKKNPLPDYNQGFSTIELIVTLFVAAAFLVSGYQLFSAIIKDGSETKQQAKASNVAYNYLQQYKNKAITSLCNNQPTVADIKPTVSGLTNVTVSIAYSCPNTSLTSLTKVLVTVKYGNPQKQVMQATYVNKA